MGNSYFVAGGKALEAIKDWDKKVKQHKTSCETIKRIHGADGIWVCDNICVGFRFDNNLPYYFRRLRDNPHVCVPDKRTSRGKCLDEELSWQPEDVFSLTKRLLNRNYGRFFAIKWVKTGNQYVVIVPRDNCKLVDSVRITKEQYGQVIDGRRVPTVSV